ncbi:hypothetical protein C475_03149 [Halosimplex carlsbadense 2-9-1]|uniref:Uncharacterized protein n=1 Tax=Halosimplex carlsbadense 2-9-1 TaxID=797114 RepID=M0D162_9EURY|nr:hypothetical protein [Halosimplex carlsbadense]ELZ29180.1 hypothetical protein C475_03149 [Halosimplex carlsbadense 2-9-1]
MSESGGSGSNDDGDGGLRHWLFLDGNRLLITALVSLGVFAVVRVAVAAGALAVGPSGNVPTVFGSGITAGVFTLVTLTLTINQLVSSQVFGKPDSLRQRYQKGVGLRDAVTDLGDRTTTPVDTAEFVAAVGEALDDRADSLRDARRATATADSGRTEGTGSGDGLAALADDLSGYAEGIQRVSGEMKPVEVISKTAGSDYARFRRRLRAATADADLPDRVADDADAVGELLGHLSVARQYYKTLALHQELAKLSREIIYLSVPCLLVALSVPLLYRSNGATLSAAALPWVISGAVAVVLAPLVVLVVRLLRVSTVMRYTVSTGPFAPPEDWPWNE